MIKERATLQSMLSYISEHGLQSGSKLPSEPVQVRELGVSKTTVRRAMKRLEDYGIIERRHGSGTYLRQKPTDKMMSKILTSAVSRVRKAPGYGRIGRKIVTQRTYRIAFLHNWDTSSFVFKSVLIGVSQKAQEGSHVLTIGPSRPPSDNNIIHKDFSQVVYQPDVDGIVLWVSRLHDSDIEHLGDIPVPYFLIDLRCPCNNSIGLDTATACRQAVYHLARESHPQIAVLEPLFHHNSLSRLGSVCDFLNDELSSTTIEYFTGKDPLAELLAQSELPTGLYFNDDVYCAQACTRLADAGLVVGKDMEVVSATNKMTSSILPDKVGHVEFDLEELGSLAVQMLERRIADKETEISPIMLGGILRSGQNMPVIPVGI